VRRLDTDVTGVAQRYARRRSATLGRRLFARVIDENPPHELSRDRKEVRAILPRRRALPNELQVQLVDEGGRLERVIDPFAPERPPCDAPEFGVYDWQQLFERVTVATAPIDEQARDICVTLIARAPGLCSRVDGVGVARSHWSGIL
jgi:hypothetical protein